MKIIIGTKKDIDKIVAKEIFDLINKKPNAVLGLATGTTPIGVYDKMIGYYKKRKLSYKEVITFNLDEYLGLNEDNVQSYRYFMNQKLFNHIDINPINTHVLKGTGDYEKYMREYDKQIESFGGIDLQILGVGSDGHIGFNEPGTSFDSLTHITNLTESTIKDNSRLFDDISQVPTQAITMGLKSIMNAKKIILIAIGKNKAKAIHDLIREDISENIPCSILKNHPDCTIYVDSDAYSLV